MLTISISAHRTLTDPDDPFNKYTVFDLHVNGAFHASVRYNLLYALHEKLVAAFGFRLKAPEFPPKKIWKLDARALNDRQEGLAKYLQGVIANPDVAKHIILEKAFLEFQVKSFFASISRLVRLEIFLPDGRPVYVECCPDDPTSVVMEKFCRVIAMHQGNAKYFGLFLGRPRIDRDQQSPSNAAVHFNMLCIRWLKNFESPFISQQFANANAQKEGQLHKILVHRVTWDPSVEEHLLDDPGSLKILYLQALNDIQNGLLKLPMNIKEKLNALEEFGDFKQFVRICHLQPGYGFEWLAPVQSDFPQSGTQCQLKVGRRQLVLEHRDSQNNSLIQSRFYSKRIRIWRVSHSESQPNSDMTFQLEYLARPDQFTMVTLHADPPNAVLLSLFLQSIADEILQTSERADSPFSYKFHENISEKASESLETTRANSVIADDMSIRSFPSNGLSDPAHHAINGCSPEFVKLISYQMPFLDHESFDDVTDVDL